MRCSRKRWRIRFRWSRSIETPSACPRAGSSIGRRLLEALLSRAAGQRGEAPMNADTLSLAGRRAVVTGAGRGIGRSIALALAAAGADVALSARSRDELEQVAQELR